MYCPYADKALLGEAYLQRRSDKEKWKGERMKNVNLRWGDGNLKHLEVACRSPLWPRD